MPDHRQRRHLTVIPTTVPLEAARQVADRGVNVFEDAVSTIDAAMLRRRLRSLPLLEARVIRWLFGIDGPELTIRQVAARLGYSVGGVHKIKERALLRLRDL